MSQLKCTDLCLGYDGREIIHNLNFEVNAGDYLCIVGENGSGKTTLMRTLLGLQPALSGEIVPGDGLKRNEIGYLPQQTVIQRDFPATVREIVISGCQGKCGLRPFYNRSEKNRAAESMAKMGVSSLAGRCYRELSGGQQQRVLLSRALCATKKLILLDEPVSSLDPVATEEMYGVIKRLNSEGITVIMITHDLQAAATYATHILHIGKNVYFGARNDYPPFKNSGDRTCEGGDE